MHIRRYNTQPQSLSSIDYEGLGNEVKFLFNPTLGAVDTVTGRRWTPNGTPEIEIANGGRVFAFNGGADRYGITNSYPELSGYGTFFASLPKIGPPSAFGQIYFRVAGVLSLQIGELKQIYISGAYLATYTGDWFNTSNRSLVYSMSSTGTKVFIDGQLVVSSATTNAIIPTGNKELQLGGSSSGGQWDFSGQMLVVGWVSRQWGEPEARAFHENPHQLFKASTKRTRSVVSIGGNNYTITPNGVITLSGSTNLLKTKVFLPSGNISFNGTNPSIKTKIISPDGNITLSGDSPLIKTKVVNASGTISFSGISPIIRSKVIEANGSVNFSGTASLSGAVSYILTPIGSVTFNGSSSLIKSHIQIPTGKISFSGNSPMESNTVIITVSTRLPLTGVGK